MAANVPAPAAISVDIAPTAEQAGAQAGRLAADVLRRAFAQRGRARVIFASAPSQEATISTLGAAEGIDWSKVTSMHLDDYLGLDPQHPAAFGQWLSDRLPEQAQPGLDRIRTDGEAGAEVERYTQALEAGPIDLVCLGIGVNGHLAFNEPGDTHFNEPALVRQIALAHASRQQQVDEGLFATLDEVPTHALTLTVPAIMRGAVIVCTVLGEPKAAAVAAALTGPIAEELPASALRTHASAHLFLDEAAAGSLPDHFPARRVSTN
ncbi:6-phosphogluconolactonase [Pseudactinotalea sp. Z1739]|uniref:6-phosphogluconolactonase n=1 Tax=Pseudactinotalea sp. Z1739 TaxID=3413028 RepID=UPI003C79C71C